MAASRHSYNRWANLVRWLSLCSLLALAPGMARAQQGNNQNQNNQNPNANFLLPYRSVGGISITADGLLENAGVDAQGRLGQVRAQALEQCPVDLNELAPLRKISLRGLEAAIDECLKAGKPLTDDLRFLGGLQQVRYVFVYPEQKDIVLVGPAEGWKANAKGSVVGVTTGRPVLLLDDLLTALRTAGNMAQAGITCSIDPTPEGLKQVKAYFARQRTMGEPKVVSATVEQALGRQHITFSGIPTTSHFAQVLAAADYRMKRIAMNFERSPVRGLPSFLQMMGPRGGNLMPRWWLEPKYDAVLRDPEGLAWELRGGSAKCMTEEDYLTAAGNREHSGKANPMAQRWADMMTEKYDELAVAEPVFGELRNCMELAIVGALVAKERLLERAHCELPLLAVSGVLKTAEMPAPKQVDSKVSMLKKGTNWVISASGGVSIYSWGIAHKAEKSDAPAAARAKVQPASAGKWCWN